MRRLGSCERLRGLLLGPHVLLLLSDDLGAVQDVFCALRRLPRGILAFPSYCGTHCPCLKKQTVAMPYC